MGMVVRTNTMAVNANRQLGMNNSQVSKSLEKLSSGFKINRAGDDASGLAISEKMKAQIKGLEQASANSQDGISLVQTAEGALTEVHSMLNRMVELATKSANGTIQNEVDRENIQNEVNALVSEIDRIGDSTNFNGINLLDGSLGSGGSGASSSGIKLGTNMILEGGNPIDILSPTQNAAKGATTTVQLADVAITAGDTFKVTYMDDKGMQKEVEVELDALAANDQEAQGNAIIDKLTDAGLDKKFDMTTDGNGLITFVSKGKETLVKAEGNTAGIIGTPADDIIVTAAQPANVTINDVGADFNFNSTAGSFLNVNGKIYEFVAAGGKTTQKGAIAVERGADFKTTVDNLNRALKKNGVKVETIGTALTGGTDAAAGTGLKFTKLDSAASVAGNGLTLQIGDTNDDFNKVTVQVDDMRSASLGVNGLDVSTQTSAGDSIQTIRDAINMVSMNRGNLGALQNRLEYTINNLDVSAENMTAANSRIRDTDMAKEMMNYTKMNVLVQSAQAMLAQANQQPQSILQLLQ